MCLRGGSVALIKTKCLPVLLFGTVVCPTYSADVQSMQFTINRIIIKLFGPMSQNCYQEESHNFGIKSVKELICRPNHFAKFIMSYSTSNNCTACTIWFLPDVEFIVILLFFAVFLGYRCFDCEIKSYT